MQVLRVGLTGGIGSGKSTVGRRLVRRGALLVDSDALAREAVAAGSAGLAEIVEAFGPELVGPDGELDRPRMASVVFGDPAARDRLGSIIHPRVRRRSEEMVAAAPVDAIVVQDVPLLVENGMVPAFPLVVVVHADSDERVRRLLGSRGASEADIRSRIAAQAGDDARRGAADVWLDNSGRTEDLMAVVDELWDRRLVPFERNLRECRAAPDGPPRLVGPDPRWPVQAARLATRVAFAAGERGHGVEHVGPTAVPGLPAEDVIDLQLAVRSRPAADTLRAALAGVGWTAHRWPAPGDVKPTDSDPVWRYRSADPGRPAHLQVREVGSPGWRVTLLLRDWLRADEPARTEYRAAWYGAAGGRAGGAGYGERHDPWLDQAVVRAERWAAGASWHPATAAPRSAQQLRPHL